MGNKASIWKKGYYDVPTHYTEEQVQAIAPKYIRRFGEHLEREGFTVLGMMKPVVAGAAEHEAFTHPDTKRYSIFAQVTRMPRVVHYDIPDYAVPAMQKIGLKLTGG